MNRKVLIAGASALMVLGLSACGSQRPVVPMAQSEPISTTAAPTEHEQILSQLDRIESKIPTATKTVTKTTTKTTTVTASPTTSTTTTPPPPIDQTLGVGGVATPPDAKSLPAVSSGVHKITSPGVYDCKGATVARIDIKTSGTTVQNCKVVANSQYGIYSSGDNNTIQNNDIKGLKPTGDGDMNGVTFFGNKTVIAFNTAIDMVATDPDDSHTDFIQTWVSTSHPTASSDVVIRGNKAIGPANPKRLDSVPSIHQCVMVEDKGRGGNSGGDSTGMKNWLVISNEFGDSWNQCIKNDGVDNFVVTKNKFVGSSTRVMEQASGSGLKFHSDNVIGDGYGSIGVPVTSGAGPN